MDGIPPEINPDDYAQFVGNLRAYFEAQRAAHRDGGAASDEEESGITDAMESELLDLFAGGKDRPLDAAFAESLLSALSALSPDEEQRGAVPGWADFVARLFRYEQDFLLDLDEVQFPEQQKTALRRQMVEFFRSLARQLTQHGGHHAPPPPLPQSPEETQEAILAALSDPCALIDTEGRIRYINQALRMLLPAGTELLGTTADLWFRWEADTHPRQAIRRGMLTAVGEPPLFVQVHRIALDPERTLWLMQREAAQPGRAMPAVAPPHEALQLHEENQRLRAIYRTWLALSAANTEEELLPVFLRRLNEVIPWGVATVLLLDQQTPHLWTSLATDELSDWSGLTTRMLEHFELFAHQTLPGVPPRMHALGLAGSLAAPGALPPSETLTLPLVAGDRVWGLLALWRGDGLPYSSHEVQGIAILSHGLAATWRQLLTTRSLQRTHDHIQQELRFARRVQRNFLPQPLPHAQIRLTTRFVPASHLSGDFYLFDQPTDGPLTVVIGDVAGHGVPAALMMTTMIGLFTELLPLARDRFAELLPLANIACCQVLEENYFVTTQALRLMPQSRTGMLYNAGHPPPLHVRASDGSCRPLDSGGLPLGMFPDAAYAARDFAWAPGDRLLLYTDGLIEARDGAGRPFGRERLRLMLESEQATPASQLLDRLVSAAQSQTGGQPLSDDIALICVDFLG